MAIRRVHASIALTVVGPSLVLTACGSAPARTSAPAAAVSMPSHPPASGGPATTGCGPQPPRDAWAGDATTARPAADQERWLLHRRSAAGRRAGGGAGPGRDRARPRPRRRAPAVVLDRRAGCLRHVALGRPGGRAPRPGQQPLPAEPPWPPAPPPAPPGPCPPPRAPGGGPPGRREGPAAPPPPAPRLPSPRPASW